MKGIVFTEFLDMVEDEFGPELADQIIEQSDLATGGVYTAVGTYPHSEIITLFTNLAKTTGKSIPTLLRNYGHYLFGRFYKRYPFFFEKPTNTFEFLTTIENTIHVEVRKLYEDAELPTFECRHNGDDQMEMTYRSARALSDLALGLIEGCAAHYAEKIEISREDLSDGKGTCVKFHLRRN